MTAETITRETSNASRAAKRVAGYLLLLAAAAVLCAFVWQQQQETLTTAHHQTLLKLEPVLVDQLEDPAPPSIPAYFGAALLLAGAGVVLLERNAYTEL